MAIAWFLAMASMAFLAIAIIVKIGVPETLDSSKNKSLLDLSQLLNNFATTAVLFVAIFAFFATRGQLKEAENVRKIQVYMKIIDMWDSDGVANSRKIITALSSEWNKCGLKEICLVDDYINYRLTLMISSKHETDHERYKTAVKVLELFEYIGILVREGEIDRSHIFDFMGSNIIQITETYMLSHIVTTRRRFNVKSNYANVLFLLQEARKAGRVSSVSQFTIDGFGCD